MVKPATPAGDWLAVAPRAVALDQLAWERAQRALRMRSLGMSYAEIGRRMGISKSRVGVICCNGGRPPPIQRWLASGGELAAMLKRLGG